MGEGPKYSRGVLLQQGFAHSRQSSVNQCCGQYSSLGKLRAWEIDRKGKLPKSASGRVQKVFWTQGVKVSEKSFAPPKTAFAPVQNGVAPVQEALCSLGPKDLLHPPRSTFGNLPFSVNFPGPQHVVQIPALLRGNLPRVAENPGHPQQADLSVPSLTPLCQRTPKARGGKTSRGHNPRRTVKFQNRLQ